MAKIQETVTVTIDDKTFAVTELSSTAQSLIATLDGCVNVKLTR